MVDLERIYDIENHYYTDFTNQEVRDYGLLYYNPENPESHDSNHAHILSFEHSPDMIISDVVAFYRQHQLIPRIYPSFRNNELTILKPFLLEHGFTIETPETTYMLFQNTYMPQFPDIPAQFQRITKLTPDIINLLHSDGTGDWGVKVLQTHLGYINFHLLGLFVEEKCRAIASIKIMDGYTRIDDVLTHLAFRGQHLGTQLMNYLVQYHMKISDNGLYLWATNPIAIHLYQNVGFREFALGKPSWTAWLDNQ